MLTPAMSSAPHPPELAALRFDSTGVTETV